MTGGHRGTEGGTPSCAECSMHLSEPNCVVLANRSMCVSCYESLRRSAEEAMTCAPDPNDHELSRLETEVLHMVTLGMNNVEIGEQLRVARRTIERIRSNILRKLALSTDGDGPQPA